jgi:hypothetical protein
MVLEHWAFSAIYSYWQVEDYSAAIDCVNRYDRAVLIDFVSTVIFYSYFIATLFRYRVSLRPIRGDRALKMGEMIVEDGRILQREEVERLDLTRLEREGLFSGGSLMTPAEILVISGDVAIIGRITLTS